jgi:hypothetical protein
MQLSETNWSSKLVTLQTTHNQQTRRHLWLCLLCIMNDELLNLIPPYLINPNASITKNSVRTLAYQTSASCIHVHEFCIKDWCSITNPNFGQIPNARNRQQPHIDPGLSHIRHHLPGALHVIKHTASLQSSVQWKTNPCNTASTKQLMHPQRTR